MASENTELTKKYFLDKAGLKKFWEVNKEYFLPLSGGEITGPLTVVGKLTAASEATIHKLIPNAGDAYRSYIGSMNNPYINVYSNSFVNPYYASLGGTYLLNANGAATNMNELDTKTWINVVDVNSRYNTDAKDASKISVKIATIPADMRNDEGFVIRIRLTDGSQDGKYGVSYSEYILRVNSYVASNGNLERARSKSIHLTNTTPCNAPLGCHITTQGKVGAINNSYNIWLTYYTINNGALTNNLEFKVEKSVGRNVLKYSQSEFEYAYDININEGRVADIENAGSVLITDNTSTGTVAIENKPLMTELLAGTFVGNLKGTATVATKLKSITTDSDNINKNVLINSRGTVCDTPVTINSFKGNITAPGGFIGDLKGNADTATVAVTATSVDKINVISSHDNSNYPLVLTEAKTGGLPNDGAINSRLTNRDLFATAEKQSDNSIKYDIWANPYKKLLYSPNIQSPNIETDAINVMSYRDTLNGIDSKLSITGNTIGFYNPSNNPMRSIVFGGGETSQLAGNWNISNYKGSNLVFSHNNIVNGTKTDVLTLETPASVDSNGYGIYGIGIQGVLKPVGLNASIGDAKNKFNGYFSNINVYETLFSDKLIDTKSLNLRGPLTLGTTDTRTTYNIEKYNINKNFTPLFFDIKGVENAGYLDSIKYNPSTYSLDICGVRFNKNGYWIGSSDPSSFSMSLGNSNNYWQNLYVESANLKNEIKINSYSATTDTTVNGFIKQEVGEYVDIKYDPYEVNFIYQPENDNIQIGFEQDWSNPDSPESKPLKIYRDKVCVGDDKVLTEADINDITNIISVTYEELVNLRNIGELKPGRKYRITDYVTTVVDNAVSNDTFKHPAESANHRFDIIVEALNEVTLSEQAKAVHNDEDGYFDADNLGAWQLWYCLDNDINRFSWADEENGKGVIYRMIDEHNNDCPYDFKNVLYMISEIAYEAKNYDSLFACSLTRSYEDDKNVDDTTYFAWKYNITAGPSGEGMVWTTIESLVPNCTFFDVDLNVTDVVSISEYHRQEYTFGSGCYNNVIKTLKSSNVQHLNDIVFGDNCKNNSIGFDSCGLIFGDECKNNSFANSSQHKNFGNHYEDNIDVVYDFRRIFLSAMYGYSGESIGTFEAVSVDESSESSSNESSESTENNQ